MGNVCSSEITVRNCNNQAIYSYALPKRNFNEVYDLGEEIGIGSFATVNKCFRKSDSKEFAVKQINKTYLTQKELICLKDEVKILQHARHENIIKLIDVFDNGKYVFMVLELCNGKDLFDTIVETVCFTENQAAQIVYELSNALKYLHQNGIVHRDLKPENILFSLKGTLKLSDFGLACYTHGKSKNNKQDALNCAYMHTCCGTPHYVAPEIIQLNEYNFKCDLWSLGVILYIMLVGYQPFRADSLNRIYKLIVKGTYDFSNKRWENISQEAKDLVQCLLEIDPKKRYDANDVQGHPWIIQHIKSKK